MKTFMLSLLSVLAINIVPFAAAQSGAGGREGASSFMVHGQALYEKIRVTSEGLDLEGRPVIVPVRGAQVDVFNSATGEVVSTSETDGEGFFRIDAPEIGAHKVRVLSRSVSAGVVVADNTSNGRIYAVEADIVPGQPLALLASDDQRISGAFNLLEVVRSANEFLKTLSPGISLPELSLFWSPNNSTVKGSALQGAIGNTLFDTSGTAAFVLGDRQSDSDEFDDAVILHEYAHVLAARFSRDDSLGGDHLPGDVLDPRVAWSEGWANFFACVVRGVSIYRDSYGPDGEMVLEFDLEVSDMGQSGYWSEKTVHSILWDLADDRADLGDAVQVELNLIWQAFTSLTENSFVYLQSFLDELTALLPREASAVEQTVRQQFIPYIGSDEARISSAFPKLIVGDRPVSGEVDSWSSGRFNLAQSAHLYAFQVRGGALSAVLEITGLGPAENPRANDLDLILMDSRGRIVRWSHDGTDGETERISTFLPAGTYVVEVRSYQSDGETGEFSFNSGTYRLAIRAP